MHLIVIIGVCHILSEIFTCDTATDRQTTRLVTIAASILAVSNSTMLAKMSE